MSVSGKIELSGFNMTELLTSLGGLEKLARLSWRPPLFVWVRRLAGPVL